MGNSINKIQEVIDQSLSDTKYFEIQFDKQTLKLESKIEPYSDLFLLFILIPSIALLSVDLKVWFWILAFSWLVIFGRKYWQVVSSFNTTTFNSKDKTLKLFTCTGFTGFFKTKLKWFTEI